MRQLILAFLILTFSSCNNNKATRVISTVDSLTNKSGTKIFIKDKSKYSKVFIDELTATKYPDSIKVIDNYIIFGKNKTNFPNDLTINKDYIFKATKDNQSYLLKVKRINETTVKFDFNLYKKDKLVFTDKGEANISATFFLGTEADTDVQTGKTYFYYEYFKNSNSGQTAISVRIGKNGKNKQEARIQYYDDKSKIKLKLDRCPFLQTE